MFKTLALFLLVSGLLLSCKKENNTSMVPLDDAIDTSGIATDSGRFSNGPYGTVSGLVKIYLKNGRYSLALENVSISNGPDLHVYLSREMIPINFLDLGRLRSTTGTMVYEIPAVSDLEVYKYVLIHCQLFDHLFGSAPLL